jgi:hypothetical protein
MPNYRGLAEEIAAGVLRNGAKLGAESILAHLEAAHEDGLAARFARDIMMATAGTVVTPAEGFLKAPHAVPRALEDLFAAGVRQGNTEGAEKCEQMARVAGPGAAELFLECAKAIRRMMLPKGRQAA